MYHCEAHSQESEAQDDLEELRWMKPSELMMFLEGNREKEDIENRSRIANLIEKLDEDDSEAEVKDPIDRLINQRIEAMGSGPLGGFADGSGVQGSGGSDKDVGRLEERIERIERAVVNGQQQQEESDSSVDVEVQEDDESESVDDIFDKMDGDDDDETQSDDTGSGEEETEETTETDDEGEDYPGDDMFSTEEVIDE
jgi:hypothetical protein